MGHSISLAGFSAPFRGIARFGVAEAELSGEGLEAEQGAVGSMIQKGFGFGTLTLGAPHPAVRRDTTGCGAPTAIFTKIVCLTLPANPMIWAGICLSEISL